MNNQSESRPINPQHKIGWIGTGRMGFAMARRLLQSGCDLAVFNRTREKAEPLEEWGAAIVDRPAALADRDIVFTMVSGPADLLEVICGEAGVLSTASAPHLVVDCSSVSEEGSIQVRKALADRGSAACPAAEAAEDHFPEGYVLELSGKVVHTHGLLILRGELPACGENAHHQGQQQCAAHPAHGNLRGV